MLQTIVSRVMRLAKGDLTVVPEVRDDQHATVQAALIVIASSILAAVGTGSWRGFLVGALLGPVISWLLWTSLAWLLGTRVFDGASNWLGLARTLGYATAPTALLLLRVVPCSGPLVTIVAWVLAVVAVFFAIRETMALSTEKALITVIISGVCVPVAYTALQSLLGAIG